MTQQQHNRYAKIGFWLFVGFVFLFFLYEIRSILLPFIMGAVIAYFLDPAADKLEARGHSRSLSTVIVIGSFFLIIVAILGSIAPLAVDQFSGLLSSMPEYFGRVESYIQGFLKDLPFRVPNLKSIDYSSITAELAGPAQNLGATLLASTMFIINFASLIIITPVVAYYLLRDWDVIVARLDALLPRHEANTIREQAMLIDRSLSAFIRGQSTVMISLGLFYAATLTLVGLKYGFVIGLIAGMLIIIPYLGTTLGGLLSVGMAMVQFDGANMPLIVGCVFVVGQIMEGYFLTPKMVGDRLGLHPLWVMFSVLAGGAMFGFMGMLIALPVTAIVAVLMRFAIARYLGSEYYRDGPKSSLTRTQEVKKIEIPAPLPAAEIILDAPTQP